MSNPDTLDVFMVFLLESVTLIQQHTCHNDKKLLVILLTMNLRPHNLPQILNMDNII